jgi:hypothetical protein
MTLACMQIRVGCAAETATAAKAAPTLTLATLNPTPSTTTILAFLKTAWGFVEATPKSMDAAFVMVTECLSPKKSTPSIPFRPAAPCRKPRHSFLFSLDGLKTKSC